MSMRQQTNEDRESLQRTEPLAEVRLTNFWQAVSWVAVAAILSAGMAFWFVSPSSTKALGENRLVGMCALGTFLLLLGVLTWSLATMVTSLVFERDRIRVHRLFTSFSCPYSGLLGLTFGVEPSLLERLPERTPLLLKATFRHGDGVLRSAVVQASPLEALRIRAVLREQIWKAPSASWNPCGSQEEVGGEPAMRSAERLA